MLVASSARHKGVVDAWCGHWNESFSSKTILPSPEMTPIKSGLTYRCIKIRISCWQTSLYLVQVLLDALIQTCPDEQTLLEYERGKFWTDE